MSNVEFYPGKTIVFWDVHDCPIPYDMEACDFTSKCKFALREMGSIDNFIFLTYVDSNSEIPRNFSGLPVFYVAAAEDERRKMILVNLFGYALKYGGGGPLNLVLIMGDISVETGFISAIHLLKKRGYNVHLAQHQNVSSAENDASAKLGGAAWLRKSISLGKNLITPKQSP